MASSKVSDDPEGGVLGAVARILGEALSATTEEALGRFCLDVACELTASRFGIIGEICPDKDRLRLLAVSEQGWRDNAMAGVPGRVGRTEITVEIHGLYGRVIADGEGFFSNDPDAHPDSVGTPPGHPSLESFIGVPLVDRGAVFGVIALGNRAGGYDDDALHVLRGLAPAVMQAFVSKRAESALRASEQRLAGIVESAMDAIVALDDRGRICLFNPAAEAMFGAPRAAWIGQPLSRLVPQRFHDALARQMYALSTPGGAGSRTGTRDGYMGRRANGEEFPVEVSMSGASADGSALTVILRDVSERQRVDAALRDSERRYRTLMDILPAAVYTCDADGRITFCNERAVELWGRRPGDGETDRRFCGSFRLRTADGEVLPHAQTPMARAVATGQSCRNTEITIERPDGSLVEVLVNIDPLRAADGSTVGAINAFIDVGEIKRTERALRASEEQFRALAESMPQLVWTANPDGQVDYYNRRVLDFEGISYDADGAWTWQPVLHDDDTVPTVSAWREAVESGGTYQCEHRVRMADGSLRWHLSRAVPAHDDDGRLVKWYGTATDIHDLKQAQARLQEADQRKDEFIATLAHELRNPLAPIRSAVDIFKLKGPADGILVTAREIIERQVTHMVRMIDDLLDVSRLTRGKLSLHSEPLLLADILAQMHDVVRSQIDSAAQQVRITQPERAVLLHGDAVRLVQVFANLLHNASKFSPSGSCIDVVAETEDGGVEIAVRDRGAGIATEHLDEVFALFGQVPAEAGQSGLGIGLSLSRKLVEMHGGRISVDSEGPGRGSVFTVWLPTSKGAALPAPARDAPAATTGGRRILLVDDNPDVVESMAALLRLHGHEVATAGDGRAGVEAAARQRPELVVLDLGMPVLDGIGACREIRQTPWGRDAVILALTGWGQDADRRRTRAAGFDGHLVKPADPALLLEWLDRAARRQA
jgi:two-component system CheB/CheR fusion protein